MFATVVRIAFAILFFIVTQVVSIQWLRDRSRSLADAFVERFAIPAAYEAALDSIIYTSMLVVTCLLVIAAALMIGRLVHWAIGTNFRSRGQLVSRIMEQAITDLERLAVVSPPRDEAFVGSAPSVGSMPLFAQRLLYDNLVLYLYAVRSALGSIVQVPRIQCSLLLPAERNGVTFLKTFVSIDPDGVLESRLHVGDGKVYAPGSIEVIDNFVQFRCGEGFAGRAWEYQQVQVGHRYLFPLFIPNPRYKKFSYQSDNWFSMYIAIPIINHRERKLIGVLCFTLRRSMLYSRMFTMSEDYRMFSHRVARFIASYINELSKMPNWSFRNAAFPEARAPGPDRSVIEGIASIFRLLMGRKSN